MTLPALTAAVAAARGDDRAAFEASLDRLVGIARPELSAALVDEVQAALRRAWSRGWQPADVARCIRRDHGPLPARLAEELIGRQAHEYPSSDVDDRWAAQLRSLPSPAPPEGPGGYLDGWAARTRTDPFLAVRSAVETLAAVLALPVVPRLIAPPGTAGAAPTPARRSSRDPAVRMLDRVRALLAKAESSRYTAEAESFTAKAQELTSRYSLDHALLAGRSEHRLEPTAIRLGVDRPYEDAKALLLQNVAEANLARSVWSADLGFATVFGFPDDLPAIELIFTSLLIQATTAMVRQGSGPRARDFRESFLHAYADRIGERLRASAEAARAGATADLLPVLATRESAVQEKVSAVFGEFTTRRTRIRDEHGWRSGRAAADTAALDPGGRR